MAEGENGRRRIRAGHGDRERAVRSLSEHFAEGRLDPEEFDRRVTDAYAAVHLDQLRVLFADLPGFGAAFGDDVVDGGPCPSGDGRTPGPGSVPAYRADSRWSPPPTTHSRYGLPPAARPASSPAVVGAVVTVAVVLLVMLLLVLTRGAAMVPLVFVALPFVFGGARRRRRPPF